MYSKSDAIRDLVAIIHARSGEASADHPWCEVRMGKNGPYHRFPPKLQAMARLMKLMGWDKPGKVEIELKDNFVELLLKVRSGELVPGHCSDIDDSPEPSPSEESDPDGRLDTPITRLGEPRSPSLSQCSTTALPDPLPSSGPSTCGSKPSASCQPSTPCGYTHDSAIADLVSIIQARPCDASPNHPLCEMRMSSWGPYHRFPTKLAALVLLSRMHGWNQPAQVQVDHDPDHRFKSLRAFIAQRK